jgi:HK97 family phage portal protein
MMQSHLAMRGNGYNLIQSNASGEIVSLVPQHPDLVTVELTDAGAYRYRIKQRDGSENVYSRAEVFHLRGLSSNGVIGMSPIELARESIGLGMAAQTFGSRFFANDARPLGGWIEYSGKFKDKDARLGFKESWQAMQGGSNRGKTAVLDDGMKFHEIGLNNRDSQFLEVRQFQVPDICRFFGVPPHMVGDLSRATFSNIEQQSIEFVTYTMTPWAERWEAAIEAELIYEDEDLEVEFDFAGLLRGDSGSRAEYYASGILNGWLTRNEARVAENLDPIDGLSKPLVPLNMAEEGAAAPAGNTIPGPADDAPMDDQAAADPRLFALATAAAERVARRETELVMKALQAHNWPAAVREVYEKHARFVADVLHVDLAVAQAYCEQRRAVVRPGAGQLTTDAGAQLVSLALTGAAPAVDSQTAMANGLQAIASAIERQPAPVVNVAAPVVNVETPAVTVHTPAPQVDVHVPPPVAMKRTPVRNADGVIDHLIDTPIKEGDA